MRCPFTDPSRPQVSLLEEAGPRQRALESKWGKMLGGGADQLPGVHFKQTDELHHERDVASSKVARGAFALSRLRQSTSYLIKQRKIFL